MTHIVGILGIALLIIVHELGHFGVARLCGMRVLRFSVGFLKPLIEWRPRDGETVYSIGALPLGGFVQVDGLSPADEVDPEDRRSYANQPLIAKLAMVVAGPAANFLTAVALFALLLVAGIPVPSDEPVIGSTSSGFPAAEAGLEPGDRILSVAGEQVASWEDLAERIHGSPGKAVVIRYSRSDDEGEVTVTPRERDGIGLIGIGPSVELEKRGPIEAISGAFVKAATATAGMAAGIFGIITGQVSTEGVSGPVGIVRMSADWLRAGWRSFLMFLAQISLSLCLVNFLPLPALDGGRVVFLAVEAITRRRVNRTVEGYVHAVGLILLLGLILLVTVRDVLNLF